MSKLGANEHVEVGTRAQLPPPAPGSSEAKLVEPPPAQPVIYSRILMKTKRLLR
ncbi:MAG: hypothetical protein KAJ31_01215 [Deltaproteobacteria bacterium]|nr:hypothetical protein [Deltaproteobacteria bacterium]